MKPFLFVLHFQVSLATTADSESAEKVINQDNSESLITHGDDDCIITKSTKKPMSLKETWWTRVWAFKRNSTVNLSEGLKEAEVG